MAGTINYLYDPDQVVWVITNGEICNSAVLAGTVLQVKGNVLTTGVTLRYDIRLEDEQGIRNFIEADVFDSLNAAVAEYEIRLT